MQFVNKLYVKHDVKHLKLFLTISAFHAFVIGQMLHKYKVIET